MCQKRTPPENLQNPYKTKHSRVSRKRTPPDPNTVYRNPSKTVRKANKTSSGVAAKMILLLHPPVGRGPFRRRNLVKPMENRHFLRARRACPCVLWCHMTRKTRFTEILQNPCENNGFCTQDTDIKKRYMPGNLPKQVENKAFPARVKKKNTTGL